MELNPTRPSRVALIRSDNRRGAIAQALALIADELPCALAPLTVLKPNLVSHHRQAASTHADALSATVDALLASGARDILVTEGASNASIGFKRFGYLKETFGRPVRYFDLNREETAWDRLELIGVDGSPLSARISRTITQARARVSLALAKTHVVTSATYSLKNWLSSIHPEDRIMMHGYRGGNGQAGWKSLVLNWLKGDSLTVHWATRVLGRVRNLKHQITNKTQFSQLSPTDLRFLKSISALNRNLARLANRVRPTLSIIDGFEAMHREGPRHGTPIHLGAAIAGTDPVAVDAVAALIMGFDPRDIGHLVCAAELGLGTIDLDHIEIVGDSIAQVARRCVMHSNFVVQRHWRKVEQRRESPKLQLAMAEA